jgi:hypothetical protein
MLNRRLGLFAKIASGALLAALLLIVAGLSTPAQATGATPPAHFVVLHMTPTHLQPGTPPILLTRCVDPLQTTFSFTGLSSHIGGDWLEPIPLNCGTPSATLHISTNPAPINWLLAPGITR